MEETQLLCPNCRGRLNGKLRVTRELTFDIGSREEIGLYATTATQLWTAPGNGVECSEPSCIDLDCSMKHEYDRQANGALLGDTSVRKLFKVDMDYVDDWDEDIDKMVEVFCNECGWRWVFDGHQVWVDDIT